MKSLFLGTILSFLLIGCSTVDHGESGQIADIGTTAIGLSEGFVEGNVAWPLVLPMKLVMNEQAELLVEEDCNNVKKWLSTTGWGAAGANISTIAVGAFTPASAIIGVAAGTYFVNATWEPSNNNNLLKGTNTVILTGVEAEVSISGNLTHDIALAGAVSGGDMVFDLDEWVWDNTHSTIEFEFPYDAFNAVFTGIFGRVGFDKLYFDEANPENTVIKAWVDVTSVETGSASPPCGHGRDGIHGCIGGTYGVEFDPATELGVGRWRQLFAVKGRCGTR